MPTLTASAKAMMRLRRTRLLTRRRSSARSFFVDPEFSVMEVTISAACVDLAASARLAARDLSRTSSRIGATGRSN